MERGSFFGSTPFLEQELQWVATPMSSSTAALASFAAALDIILLTIQTPDFNWDRLHERTLKALRLTCKATRNLVDLHIQSLCCSKRDRTPRDHDERYCDGLLSDISPWPWQNITKVELSKLVYYKETSDQGRCLSETRNLQQDVENLATLPLKKLTSLTLECLSAMPLAKSNWPMLTYLELEVLLSTDIASTPLRRSESQAGIISYPKDLQFPRWPLKKFVFRAEKSINVAFLGPLLKSCPELRDLKLYWHYYQLKATDEMAEMIASAPLPKLESLELMMHVCPGFYPKLFEREWPELKTFISSRCNCELVVPILASKTWLTNLETFELKNNCYVTANDLHNFLQTLKDSHLKSLSLNEMSASILSEGFEGIVLEKLERLSLYDLLTVDLAFQPDVSNFINVLFDSCSFPNLEEINIRYYEMGIIEEDEEIERAHWIERPTKQLLDQFPVLQNIFLFGIQLSVDVADYIGEFRRQTTCSIVLLCCDVETRDLAPHRQQILDTLGIDLWDWEEYCHNQGYTTYKCYEDCSYWNILPDDDFKRIACAAALQASAEDARDT